ncbi:transporter substrate-binding domain-containing protein [Aquincola sp. MAHUQ-54]|uniref:Transporter substrate-binding domain-containing protein n=1 Tax=Aquincola agrisoli TaxID=3119538 RepID=A0AAW9Q5S0_9BURK
MQTATVLCSALVLAAGCQAPGAAQAQTIHAVTEATAYARLEGGQVKGPAPRIVEAVLREAGFRDHRMSLYPWARAYDMALHEPDVLIFLLARTPEREKQFQWVGEFRQVAYHFYKLKERTDVRVDTLDDAKHYTIGVSRDDVRHQYLRAKGFPKLVVSPSNLDSFRSLLQGQVQLLPISDDNAAGLCAQTGFDCTRLERAFTLDDLTVGLYLAFSASTPDSHVQRTRRAFERVRASGLVRRLMQPPR